MKSRENQRTEFKKALAKIAGETTDIIRRDDFPKSIRPEFLKKAVMDYPLRDGKCLRPALLLWTCGLFGGNPEKAKFAAAAVEIFHNWTLVHDDIIDNDDFRKGLPSTHRQLADFAKAKYDIGDIDAEAFGRNHAILAGDIQHAWAVNMLSKTQASEKTNLQLIVELSSFGGRDLVCGEALDVEISSQKWSQVEFRHLLQIAELKTARLLQFCTFSGAKIAMDGKKPDQCRLSKILDFAKFAGMAFQLKDDLLGVFEDKTGKPVLSDLSERKPTTILLETVRLAGSKEAALVLSLAGKKGFSKADVAMVRDIASACGAERKCRQKAEKMKNDAIATLTGFPDCEFRRLLLDWTEYVLERSR